MKNKIIEDKDKKLDKDFEKAKTIAANILTPRVDRDVRKINELLKKELNIVVGVEINYYFEKLQ